MYYAEDSTRTGPETAVAIVILNWNGCDDTLACIDSLSALRDPQPLVIVTDNGSSDDSVAAIRQRHPQVELIETGQNLGFAGGNNVGIRRALELGAEYVLLLNNDTVVAPNLLQAFIQVARQRPRAAAFAARIYFHADPQRLWYAGAAWDPASAQFKQLGEGLHDDGTVVPQEPFETAYACGCAMFIPASRLRELGLLDERYFLYFEETDWCFRASAAGYASIVVPQAKLWHKVSVSLGGEGSPLQLYFLARNRLLWASRHATRQQRLDVWRATLRALNQRLGLSVFLGRTASTPYTPRRWWWSLRQAWTDPHNRAFFLGVRDFMLRRFGNCPQEVRDLSAQARQRTQNPTAAAAVPSQAAEFPH